MSTPTTAPKPSGYIPRLTEIIEHDDNGSNASGRNNLPVPATQPSISAPSALELRDLEESITEAVLRAIPSQPDSQSEYLIRKAADDIANAVSITVTAKLRDHLVEIMQDAVYRALDKELANRRLR